MTCFDELPLNRPLTRIIDDIEAQLFRIEEATKVMEEFVEDIFGGDPLHRGVCARVAFCGLLIHESKERTEQLLDEMLHGPRPRTP